MSLSCYCFFRRRREHLEKKSSRYALYGAGLSIIPTIAGIIAQSSVLGLSGGGGIVFFLCVYQATNCYDCYTGATNAELTRLQHSAV